MLLFPILKSETPPREANKSSKPPPPPPSHFPPFSNHKKYSQQNKRRRKGKERQKKTKKNTATPERKQCLPQVLSRPRRVTPHVAHPLTPLSGRSPPYPTLRSRLAFRLAPPLRIFLCTYVFYFLVLPFVFFSSHFHILRCCIFSCQSFHFKKKTTKKTNKTKQKKKNPMIFPMTSLLPAHVHARKYNSRTKKNAHCHPPPLIHNKIYATQCHTFKTCSLTSCTFSFPSSASSSFRSFLSPPAHRAARSSCARATCAPLRPGPGTRSWPRRRRARSANAVRRLEGRYPPVERSTRPWSGPRTFVQVPWHDHAPRRR